MAMPSRIAPGKVFNRWTAIRYVSSQENRANPRWLFKCVCGNERVRSVGSVVHGSSKSCGCLRAEILSTVRVGDVFNRLTAVRPDGNGRDSRWRFKCVCGKEHVAKLYEVRMGAIKSCGCLKDETRLSPIQVGDIFGNLTAVRFDGNTGSWIFKCVCGNECSPVTHKIRIGKIKSCGCHPLCPNSRVEKEHKVKRAKSRESGKCRLTAMFSTLKSSAEKRGIPFAILKSDIATLAEKQQWRCAQTGIPLNLTYGNGQQPFGPTIDRIDNDIGYEPGNIQLVCFMYNCAKNQFTTSDVFRLARALIDQQQKTLIETLKFRRITQWHSPA